MFTAEKNLQMAANRIFVMNNTIQEEIVHVKGFPKKLIIFLHGYIDSAPSLERKIMPMLDSLNDYAVHLPQASLICELHKNKRQWYSMHSFDPDDSRKTVASFSECEAIYDKMSPGLGHAAFALNMYIDQCLMEYGLEDKDLFLCGFSQGAMLALYIALTREKMAGCISFSGIMAGRSFLEHRRISTPDTLLIHGDADNLVRFEALEFTKQKLSSFGSRVETLVVPNGLHQITNEGLEAAVNFINQRASHKKS